jgi:hypothetical protein
VRVHEFELQGRRGATAICDISQTLGHALKRLLGPDIGRETDLARPLLTELHSAVCTLFPAIRDCTPSLFSLLNTYRYTAGVEEQGARTHHWLGSKEDWDAGIQIGGGSARVVMAVRSFASSAFRTRVFASVVSNSVYDFSISWGRPCTRLLCAGLVRSQVLPLSPAKL